MRNTKTTSPLLYLIISLLTFISCQDNTPKANLILTNATIWTGNTNQPTAQAIAIAGDIILAIGTNQEIQAFKGAKTETIDLEGQFVTPGFIDCHVHLMMGGNALLSVELRDANTPKIFSQRIADYAKTIEKGEWILEGNWDHTLYGEANCQKKNGLMLLRKTTPSLFIA